MYYGIVGDTSFEKGSCILQSPVSNTSKDRILDNAPTTVANLILGVVGRVLFVPFYISKVSVIIYTITIIVDPSRQMILYNIEIFLLIKIL